MMIMLLWSSTILAQRERDNVLGVSSDNCSVHVSVMLGRLSPMTHQGLVSNRTVCYVQE